MTYNPWVKEEELQDEWNFSQIKKGWHAWNIMSPELEFCYLAAAVADSLPEGSLVIETGMGQGYVTRRLMTATENKEFWVYETDPVFIDLAEVGTDEAGYTPPIIKQGSPSLDEFRAADFVVLDSDTRYRTTELLSWIAAANYGSMVLIHDTFHHRKIDNQITSAIKRHEDRLSGCYFPNPRGCYLGARVKGPYDAI